MKAEKGSFFVFDEVATVGSEEDIVASVYEEGIGHKKEPMIFKKKTKARSVKFFSAFWKGNRLKQKL